MLLLGSLAKQRGADSHPSCASRDRSFQVVGHPHRQGIELDTGAAPLMIQGRITVLSPVVDPASGLRRIKLVFDNPDGRVVPGIAGLLLIE